MLRALRHRNFRLFFAGQGVSLIGMWMQMVAQSWLMYRLTDSAAMVGIVAIAQQGPGLFIGPFAGAYADRHSRRQMLIGAQSVSILPALIMGGLTVVGSIEAWHVIALALWMGLGRAVEMPTRQALVPQLVDREDIPNAIALNSVLFNAARLIGPALGGVVIATLGEGWCFFANAASLGPIIFALLAIRISEVARTGRESTSLWSEMLEGLRYVRGEPAVWSVLGVMAAGSIAGMPYSVLLPSFAERVLQAGPETYGVLTSAVGIGAIASAFVLAARERAEGLDRWVVVAGVLFGAGLLGFSQSRDVLVAAVMLACMGVGFMVHLAGTNTLLQLRVPDPLRGRVMALHSALFLGVFPFSGLAAGVIADRVGEAPVLAAGGVLVMCGVLLFGRVMLKPANRRSGAPSELRAAESSSR
jgi:MFS family permease